MLKLIRTYFYKGKRRKPDMVQLQKRNFWMFWR